MKEGMKHGRKEARKKETYTGGKKKTELKKGRKGNEAE